MSKGNLFLGQGRGAVGDVVFTRVNGEQVARARNRHPKNPQTAIQLLQRVVMKSAALSYSMFRDITDHSFQGKQQGTPNQSEYLRVNVAAMREQLAEIINDNDPEEIMNSPESNFSTKNDSLPVIRPYIMSGGTLSPLQVVLSNQGFDFGLTSLDWDLSPSGDVGPTYQAMVDGLGINRGDQLTFLFMYADDSQPSSQIVDFKYTRLIMEPADGDMTARVFAKDRFEKIVINSAAANPRNEGSIYLSSLGFVGGYGADSEMDVEPTHSFIGFAVIVSRENGGVWQRSRSQFLIREDTGAASTNYPHNEAFLSDAVHSFLSSQASSLYLNQAETGV